MNDKIVEAACEAYWNGQQGEDLWKSHQRKDDERKYMRDALEAAARARVNSPDYCFNADDWETTYAWRDRDELTMNLGPGDWIEVACLQSLPSKWAACIVKDGDYETLWFESEEAAREAIEEYLHSASGGRLA